MIRWALLTTGLLAGGLAVAAVPDVREATPRGPVGKADRLIATLPAPQPMTPLRVHTDGSLTVGYDASGRELVRIEASAGRTTIAKGVYPALPRADVTGAAEGRLPAF